MVALLWGAIGRLWTWGLLLAAAWSGMAGKVAAGEDEAERVFREEALPILERHCFACHSHAAGKAKGGLVLDSRSGWEKGGDSGPAITPGDPEESLLIQAVRYAELEMPPTGKLSAEDVAALERWVRMGAFDPRTVSLSEKERGLGSPAGMGAEHWAFRPLAEVGPPPGVQDAGWPLDDVDRYVLAELEGRGLRPAADADRHTWLRRVSLDLTGLPPTLAEIAAFVEDDEPGAYERVVDRLLGSRAFGERWGRHWLDLVGYADQIGTANDVFAEHAWRYRDYVIDAHNADVPFDRFIREQIAGDLLPAESPERRSAQIVATGFLVLGDLTIVEADKAKLRVDVADQQVEKIGRAFLGMTIGCARCHDHKFDPIPQRDYYAMAGILNATESVGKAEWGIWSWPTEVELAETDEQRTRREAAAAGERSRIEALRAERARIEDRKKEVDTALGSLGDSDQVKAAKELLAKLQGDLGGRKTQLDLEILHAEFFAPSPPRAFAVRDAAAPADMRVTIRGNPHALGEEVPRGFLSVVTDGTLPTIPTGESGRRQLADWIASPENPLTARVAVNRVWQKLFGEGIVRSVDYFGVAGERPSHPELLDHLARRFVAGGWSRKRLIRALVLSRAYRVGNMGQAGAAEVDPDNRLFGRMSPRRLDAEAIRDTALAVSGRLIASDGGPALPLEYRENAGNLTKPNVNPPSFTLARFRPEQEYVRTVYLPVIRSAPQAGPAELRNVFDFPQPAEFAGRRATTAVPTQALFLMNSTFMKDRSRDLARRVLEGATGERARLERLWLAALSRPITDEEAEEATRFLRAAGQPSVGGEAADAEMRRWAELCHAVLASTEFLMRF
jgi:hypothetical protein